MAMRREWSVAGALEMTTPRQRESEEKSGAPLREDGVEAQAAMPADRTSMKNKRKNTGVILPLG